ncbi:hypothetical protein RZE84_05475 [Mollicutes bacterium LVI A0075]|nr:hypothetical protein RZE84_05475 [Mollicutes bacterium LVI A0075]
MFKSLKQKLFGKVDEIQVVQEEIAEKENIEKTVEESTEKTSQDLQQQSVNLESVKEEDFLDLKLTQSIQAEYKDVISKLDSVVELVEENTEDMNTYESLQQESELVVDDSELNIVEETTAEMNQFITNSKEMLIADSEEIKKNSDTFLINEGMFDLNSQLHNAKLIIEDTDIPQAVTKQDVLEK